MLGRPRDLAATSSRISRRQRKVPQIQSSTILRRFFFGACCAIFRTPSIWTYSCRRELYSQATRHTFCTINAPIRCHRRIVERRVRNNNNNQQQQPTTNNQQPTTNNQQPTTNNQQPTTNNQQPTTNNQQPTTNNQQPTTNNQQPTTNNQQHPFWLKSGPSAGVPAWVRCVCRQGSSALVHRFLVGERF